MGQTAKFHNTHESQNAFCYMKSDSKEYLLHESHLHAFWKRQNYINKEQIFARGKERADHQRTI